MAVGGSQKCLSVVSSAVSHLRWHGDPRYSISEVDVAHARLLAMNEDRGLLKQIEGSIQWQGPNFKDAKWVKEGQDGWKADFIR